MSSVATLSRCRSSCGGSTARIRTSTAPGGSSGAASASGGGGALPFTGARGVAPLLLATLLLLALGVASLLATRRRA